MRPSPAIHRTYSGAVPASIGLHAQSGVTSMPHYEHFLEKGVQRWHLAT